jgi:hypothetical protein
MTYTITCRARVVKECLDGQPTARQFSGEDLPMSEDGTYEVTDGVPTVICDPCYFTLMPYSPSGKLLRGELPEAVRRFHQLREE